MRWTLALSLLLISIPIVKAWSNFEGITIIAKPNYDEDRSEWMFSPGQSKAGMILLEPDQNAPHEVVIEPAPRSAGVYKAQIQERFEGYAGLQGQDTSCRFQFDGCIKAWRDLPEIEAGRFKIMNSTMKTPAGFAAVARKNCGKTRGQPYISLAGYHLRIVEVRKANPTPLVEVDVEMPSGC